MRIIAYLTSGILILFGVLFILGSTSEYGYPFQFIIGLALVGIAFLIIFFLTKNRKKETQTTNVTLNIDLPGNVSLETLKCQQCGGALTKDAISIVNGAPMVTCPYCHTTYQLTEEPKW